MTNATYTLQTPDYSYTFDPVPETSNVLIKSESKMAIEDFISTVELAGPEDGQSLPEFLIEEDDSSEELVFYTEVTRATLSLFLDFEVRYYMGATNPFEN